MMERPSFSVVNFILGVNEDTATESVQCHLDYVPCVGDIVSCYSSRDKDGNYMPRLNRGNPRTVLKGMVIRVEHLIEERGESSADNCWVQFVNVYLEKRGD